MSEICHKLCRLLPTFRAWWERWWSLEIVTAPRLLSSTLYTMLEIDGSEGEGGGQMVRSSMALSALTGTPVRLFNVRAGRVKPGLKRQHLASVRAAREVCGGGLSGDELNSSEVTLHPGPIQARDFTFKVGTAGSTTLVAQTVLPALMLAGGPSSITIEGGTHNMGAPPYDYLADVYLPQVARMGPTFRASIERHGFYPNGGGRIRIEIEPATELRPFRLVRRSEPTIRGARALVSQLPISVAERELKVIRRFGDVPEGRAVAIEVTDSPGPGNVVMITFDSGNVAEIITGFGSKGVPAEKVAKRAWKEAESYATSTVPVGEHLADQLLLPLGLAAAQGQTSTFVTGALSLHSTTHVTLLQRFLDIDITVEETEPNAFTVQVGPKLA